MNMEFLVLCYLMKGVFLIEFWITVIFVNAVLLALVKAFSSICLLLVSWILNMSANGNAKLN